MKRRIDKWGRIMFRGDDAIELLFQGQDITALCIEPSQEIEEYNAVCVDRDKLDHIIHPISLPTLTPEEDAIRRQNIWFMASTYAELDVRDKLLNMCRTEIEIERVNTEMEMFEARGLLPVLRLMCYLVDRWRERNVVWGVGRGSSVASYCLFLIGVHRIDSIAYNLSITEFLK